MSFVGLSYTPRLLSLLTEMIRLARNVGVVYVAYLLIVAVHEIGHWTAALISRFLIQEFRVGPFQWLSESGWGMRWRSEAFISGLVRARLTHHRRALHVRYLVYVLAGPFANIAIGLSGLLRFKSLTRSDSAGLLALWSIGSLVIGFFSLLPIRGGEIKSDGLAIFDALVGDELRKARFALCYLETKDELIGALRRRDIVRAKEISAAELVFAEGISDTSEVSKILQVLHKIVAYPDPDAVDVEDASNDSLRLSES